MHQPELQQLVTEYLEYIEVERGYSRLTIRDYTHYLNRLGEWIAANSPSVGPQDITLDLVRKYRLYLAHLADDKGRPLLSRATQTYHVIALRAFLRYLSVKRDIPTLPYDKIELPKVKSRSIKFLDNEQLTSLLNSPNTSSLVGLRNKAILEMLFSTGLRVSELVKLDRDKVSTERREFEVIGKGSKVRVVYLSDSAAEWLERYLQRRADNLRPLFIRHAGPVGESGAGEEMRLTVRSVQRIVDKYSRECALPVKATPHTMRHSFATDLLMAGADLRSVQELLGHENISTTQVYTHVTNPHLQQIHKTYHRRVKSTPDKED